MTAADVFEVRAVLAQRRDPEVERVGHVDRVRRFRRTGSHTRSARPSTASPASAKTHGSAASRTASSTAAPVLRWSAMFSEWPPHESRWLSVTTSSGRWRRIAAVMSCRSGSPYSMTPSAMTEELDARHADDRRAGALLGLADACALFGRRACRCRPRRA